MSVRPQELENPERDLALETRENTRRFGRKPDEAQEAELQALRHLRERLEGAKANTTPSDTAPHCADCYRRGWRAALAAVEGKG